MHVRTATVQVQSGKMQELINLYKDEMAPAVKSKIGFRGQYLMTDATGEKALAISFWDTDEDVLDSEYLSEQVRAKFGSVFVGPPSYDHYELSVENPV